MSELQSAPDLRPLDGQYEVIGELRGSPTTRYLMGRRRADGTDVLIALVDGAIGGENNALAHFASDAQILASLAHPNIARVLEGRWLGTDHFAVVTERLRGSTLHEVLSADGAIPKPRIATVLQEVGAALDWAREHGVVHRGVTPESLYVDTESNRIRIALSLTPIPLEGLPDVCADGRTIGTLAWSMLAGRPYTSDSPALEELNPDLARRVVDQTMAMMSCRIGGEAPDVQRFLSVIAKGDVLREGEIEIARMKSEMIEERRVERMRLEAEARVNSERAAALQEQLMKERAIFEQRVRDEERRIASEQQQVAVERIQLEQERIELADRVAEFELRAAIERPTPVAAVTQFLTASVRDEELPQGSSRFGWMVPVATVAMLLFLIVFGSLIARHEPRAPRAVTIGNTRVVPTAPGTDARGIPRGGFLTQSPVTGSRAGRSPVVDSAAGRLGEKSRRDSLARRDTIVRRDSTTRSDTTAKSDTLARRDSTFRRDTTAARDTSIRVEFDTRRF